MQWGEEKGAKNLVKKQTLGAATARVLEKLSRFGFTGKQLYTFLCILRASWQVIGNFS